MTRTTVLLLCLASLLCLALSSCRYSAEESAASPAPKLIIGTHATYPPFREHGSGHAAACWHPHG